MGTNKTLQILSVIVIAGLITLAVVNDVASRKDSIDPMLHLADTTEDSTWLAAPEPLFDDKSNAKLKPLLGLMSGAVAIQYHGPQQRLAVSFEYWQDGVKKNTSDGMSMVMMEKDKDEAGNYHFEGDFVYSFKDHQDPNGAFYSELTYAIIDHYGTYSTATRVDKPAGIGMTGEMKLQQRVKVPRNESIVVWGMQGTDKQSMVSYSTIDETLKTANWAMTVRLSFKE